MANVIIGAFCSARRRKKLGNYCVYIHTTPNGKKYIGVTKRTPIYRWDNGNGYKHNTYFYRAIRKYGWENILHEVIITSLSLEEAEKMERDLIAKYRTTNKKYGFNIESGGITCKEISLETKQKISLANTGKKHGAMSEEAKRKLSMVRKAQGNFRNGVRLSEETKRKISEGNKGKTVIVSEETRKKISSSLMGINRSEDTRKKMSFAQKGKSHPQFAKRIAVEQIDKHGNIIKTYNSMLQASKETDTRYTGISRCCRGEIKSSNGYKWRYAM